MTPDNPALFAPYFLPVCGSIRVTIRVHIKVNFLSQKFLVSDQIWFHISISVIVYYVTLIWENTHL